MRDINREVRSSGDVVTRYGRVKVLKDQVQQLSTRRFSVRISVDRPYAWKLLLRDLQAHARRVEKYADVTICSTTGDIIFSIPVAQRGRGHSAVISRAISFVELLKEHYAGELADENVEEVKPKPTKKPSKKDRETYFNGGSDNRVWNSAEWRANRRRMANKTA